MQDSASHAKPVTLPEGAPIPRTFVGIGFGPIQAGLFLYEASASGNFTRLVAAEIKPDLVEALRASGGMYTLNVAHADRVEAVVIGPIELYDANQPSEREKLLDAIAEASEIATAVSSVSDFATDLEGSVDKILAQGLLRKRETGGPVALIYTGENNNYAAELLHEAIAKRLPEASRADVLAQVRIVNTVIGKMCGIASVAPGVAAMTDGFPRAFLVEAYNYILISRVGFEHDGATTDTGRAPFQRGISQFVEKPDLVPFEEAKLYCINALHAFAAYLGKVAGCNSMAQVVTVPGLLPLVRNAVVEEPGAALARKYADFDPFFSPDSLAAYVDDYILRMVNPALDDAIARVARDPRRKLAWEDRLIGAMRLALGAGITPSRFALGAAAALKALEPDAGDYPAGVLASLWARPQEDAETVRILDELIAESWQDLAAFVDAGSNTPRAPEEQNQAQPDATASDPESKPSTIDEPRVTGTPATAPTSAQERSNRPLTYAAGDENS